MAAKKPPQKRKSRKGSKGAKVAASVAMDAGQRKVLLGVGAIAAFLLYRHLHSGTTTAVTSGNSTASGSITPYTPQSPVLVPAGESLYDPNSQGFLTAPGGGPYTPGGGPYTYSTGSAPPANSNPATTLLAPVTTARTTRKPSKRKVTRTVGGVASIPKTKMTGQAKTITKTNRHPISRKRAKKSG